MSSSCNGSNSLPQLPIHDEPVFSAPWEARAFAIVNQLAADNHYSWAEWTNFLIQEIAMTEQKSPGSKTYYENWLIACEKLLLEKGLLSPQAIENKITELLVEREAEHKHYTSRTS